MSELFNKQIMAKNIKKYMALNNKSRTEICNDLSISYTTFADWVNAKTYPRIDKIELLANYFNIEKSDLVEENTTKEEPELIIINKAMKKMTPDQKKKMMNILRASFEEEFNEN